jgi:hypothetical protein
MTSREIALSPEETKNALQHSKVAYASATKRNGSKAIRSIQRVLSPEEIRQAMQEARCKGLPQGWNIEFGNNIGCKTWISPCGTRRCYTIRKAIAWSLEKGLVLESQLPAADQVLTKEEVAKALNDAKNKGLPATWKVEWSHIFGCRLWLAPDNRKRCKSIAEALAWSRRKGFAEKDKEKEKELPDKTEMAEGKKAACTQANELPSGWTTKWDSKLNRRIFISPDKRKICNSIAEALAWSLKNGLFTANNLEKKECKKALTPEQINRAMKDAKARGLPDGWTVQWDSRSMQRKWIAPRGRKKCQSLPEALLWAAKYSQVPDEQLRSYKRRSKSIDSSSTPPSPPSPDRKHIYRKRIIRTGSSGNARKRQRVSDIPSIAAQLPPSPESSHVGEAEKLESAAALLGLKGNRKNPSHPQIHAPQQTILTGNLSALQGTVLRHQSLLYPLTSLEQQLQQQERLALTRVAGIQLQQEQLALARVASIAGRRYSSVPINSQELLAASLYSGTQNQWRYPFL